MIEPRLCPKCGWLLEPEFPDYPILKGFIRCTHPEKRCRFSFRGPNLEWLERENGFEYLRRLVQETLEAEEQ